MNKQSLVSGGVGLVLGAIVGSVFLGDILQKPTDPPIDPVEVNIGPSLVNSSVYFSQKQISDSILAPFPNHTNGLLYDIDLLNSFSRNLSMLKKDYELSTTDSVLQLAIYPLQVNAEATCQLYFIPIIVEKAEYEKILNIPGTHLDYSKVNDINKNPTNTIFTNNVYDMGNDW